MWAFQVYSEIWALLHILPYGRPLPLLVWTVAKGIWLGLHLFLHSLFFKDQNALMTALLNPFPHPQTHHHLPVAFPLSLCSPCRGLHVPTQNLCRCVISSLALLWPRWPRLHVPAPSPLPGMLSTTCLAHCFTFSRSSLRHHLLSEFSWPPYLK